MHARRDGFRRPREGFQVLVAPAKKLPAKLAGEDVRLTVTAGSSKEKVLIVPVSAISSGADGKAVVTVYEPGGRHRRTEVTTSTTGNGFVAVRPLGRASLPRARTWRCGAMRKLLKWLGLALGVVVLLLGGFAAYVALAPLPTYPVRPPALRVEATPERVARGEL